MGGALGQSEQQTKGILTATVGKVLVIDEAYGLYGGSSQQGGIADPFKAAVIDTIVAEVQSVPGDDRCVLLLGYKDQMETMFQNVNPGLSRRFPLATAFTFDDFSNDELGRILDMKLKGQGYRVTGQARRVAMEVLQRARNQPSFGNAGEVDILLGAAKHRHQKRLAAIKSGPRDLLEAVDLDKDFDRAERAETNIRNLFEDTVGSDALIQLLIGYQSTVKSIKALGLDPRDNISFNFLFRGPPGTGKTTTAKKIGKVFYDMGFLATAEVLECSATELIGQYVGHTGPKTQQLLDRALGRVLLIDEAYRLHVDGGIFCREAVDELVACLTKDRYCKKLIVILAGYEDEINRLMSVNPGLSSRFPEVVDFRPLSTGDCIKLLQVLLTGQQDQLKNKGVDLDLAVIMSPTDACTSTMVDLLEGLILQDGWANARDVTTLATGIFKRVVKSVTGTDVHRLVLSEVMITDELCTMLKERQNRSLSAQARNLFHPEMPVARTLNPLIRQPPPTSTVQETAPPVEETEVREAEQDDCEGQTTLETQAACAANRDAGVSDAVWEQLQRDSAAELDKEENFQRLLKAGRDARGAARDSILNKVKKEEEERKLKAKMQQKLLASGLCPAGYHWIPQCGGFRCAGGSHFVSDELLRTI